MRYKKLRRIFFRNRKGICLLLIPLTFLMSACEEKASEITKGIDFAQQTEKSIEKNSLQKEVDTIQFNHDIQFKGQSIPFQMSVSLDKSRSKTWIYTVPTTVSLNIQPKKAIQNLDFTILNVYSDVSISSVYARFNGLRQDSLNIDYSEVNQQGIAIDETQSFTLPFEIEGVNASEMFIHSWYGFVSTDYSYLAEDEIRSKSDGVNLNIVWTIGIKEKDSGKVFATNIKDTIYFTSESKKEDVKK